MDYNATLLACPLVKDARPFLPRHPTERWRRRDPSMLRGVVYHQALGMSRVKDVAEFHVNPNFMSDQGLPSISYTLFVEPDGQVYLCNDVEEKTWSQGDRTRPGDENAAYLAVCFGGNFSGPGYFYPGTPTPEQLNSAVEFWDYTQDAFGFDPGALYGHFDFGKPACPGYSLEALIRKLRGPEKPIVWTQPSEKQRILKDVGVYEGPVDNIWGPQSESALVEFRKRCKLPEEAEWDASVEQAFLEWLRDDERSA